MKLNKLYTIDECQNEETLYQRLDTLVDEGKIEYELVDKWTLKIKDLDLSSNEEKKLTELFESLDLYSIEGDDEEDEDLYFGDSDESDDYDGYKPSRKGYDDEFGDY